MLQHVHSSEAPVVHPIDIVYMLTHLLEHAADSAPLESHRHLAVVRPAAPARLTVMVEVHDRHDVDRVHAMQLVVLVHEEPMPSQVSGWRVVADRPACD